MTDTKLSRYHFTDWKVFLTSKQIKGNVASLNLKKANLNNWTRGKQVVYFESAARNSGWTLMEFLEKIARSSMNVLFIKPYHPASET